MAKEYPRKLRVGEQLHRELADLIRHQLSDPHIGMVTIAEVDVSTDLKNARVYFTVLGDQSKVDETSAALIKATGFLRRALGQRVRLRAIPKLRFIYDHSEQKARQLESLLMAEREKQRG